VSTATKAGPPAGGVLDRVERTAWRVPLPTRRLFVTLALIAAGALAASGLAAGWVANRNARIIADAREQGLDLATAVSDFDTSLTAADARAAGTLISGGLEDRQSREDYDADMQAASRALVAAGLVATDADGDDLRVLTQGLSDYAGLVEASRANARQGFPVATSYLEQAQDLAQDRLVPTAEHLRREGARRMARAANDVGGVVGGLAVVLLLAGLGVLVGCSLVIAGRTRRIAHPALLAATLVAVGALVVVTLGIVSQGRELRRAASGDIDAYVAANSAVSGLANLRVTEIGAVAARGGGAALYDDFGAQADDLAAEIADAPGDDQLLADLYDAVGAYAAAVDEVRALDEGGDNRGAADLALTTSQDAYGDAAAIATAGVDNEVGELRDRFDAAEAAGVHPAVPVLLGGVAALLAAGGTLARGRRYR
jgi:hypothetical protein